MKQAFSIIVVFLLLLQSCSSLNSSKKTRSFEKTLGKENTQALTNYVNAFENEVLLNKYPTLSTDEAYLKLLSEDSYTIPSMKLYDLFTSYNLEKYFKSQLWHEIYAPVDSVWSKNSELRIRYVYLSEDGKKEVAQIGGDWLKQNIAKDSITQKALSLCFFNNKGKYLLALKSIKKGIPFLEEYFYVKNNYGEITPSLFSEMIKRYNLDLKNTLTRQIMAVELSQFINDARISK